MSWRRPTLAGQQGPTTIGAYELNFSVRDGKRCSLIASSTRTLYVCFICGRIRKLFDLCSNASMNMN